MSQQPFRRGISRAGTRRNHGDRYEDLALQYLLTQGYILIARNVTYRLGEIDLIVEKQTSKTALLVFVEVRKTDPRSWLRPEETLSYSKRLKLIRSVQKYLCDYRGEATEVRIDLIGFRGDDLRHFTDFVRVD